MTAAEEMQDDQIYLCDLHNELREIDTRREEILHQIKCYESKIAHNETKTQEPTNTIEISEEEMEDRI